MPIDGFDFCMPRLEMGAGRLARLPEIAATYGPRVLLITGQRSFTDSPHADALLNQFTKFRIDVATHPITREPAPADIDEAVRAHAHRSIDCVIAIGGGAAIDAGKAISAMLPLHGKVSVRDFLEGIGTQTHPGCKVPFIAVPTTAGTGAEASKNAVISEVGPNGFKKSLRHDNFIPDRIILDPELHLSCPRAVTAACGMDALTQLIESYVSPRATPMTDALAWSGLEAASANLWRACHDGARDLAARGQMAYAAFCSGVTLAHAGLGVVHGLAGPIGGMFDAPHGAVCGTLLAAATRANIDWLQEYDPHSTALSKYQRLGRLFGDATLEGTDATDTLIDQLETWTLQLEMPMLSLFGIKADHAAGLVQSGGLKDNSCKAVP